MNESTFRLAGLSAYANAALYIAILVTLAIYFAIGGFWGTLNDGLSVIWVLTFVPVLLALFTLNKAANETIALAATGIGILAALIFAVLQLMLVLRVVNFEQTFLTVVSLGGLLGLMILVHGLLARNGSVMPTGLTWFMVAFGLGYLVSAAGFWLGGWENPLAAAGYLVSVITGLVWVIWLGRLWLNGRWIATAALEISGSTG